MFADWSFSGEWRRYQQLALDAFERDRLAARDRTLLVAPPGSGKTIIGLEIVRRIGEPALVLCPSQTIQRQWGEKQAQFGGSADGLHLLTYQSLCQADDPDGMLRAAAERHWVVERAGATGASVDEVAAEVASWTGAAAERRSAEVGRIVARLKKAAASGKLPDIPREELLSPTARARLRALMDAGVATVVLDECHHLASLWGALLASVLEELRPRHVIGLTATNPNDLSVEEAELYRSLLDEVDLLVPTPAVVREGHLAPYQELQLCVPLSSEHDWLAERHVRFDNVLLDLGEVVAGVEHLALSVWLVARLRERTTAGGAVMTWAEFSRRQPRLAEAGLRWLNSVGEALPPDSPRGERTRAPLTIDDWIVLLDDYALRCLGADPSEEAARRLSALQVALGDLGFTLTRTGIRRTGGEVDRVLLSSAAKPIAMCDLLDAEYESRGERLCAVVFCDTERAPRQPEDSPLTLSGGGRGLLAAVAADARFAGVRPALVTASTFAVAADDVAWWLEALAPVELSPVPEDGIVVLRGEWDSRTWVGAATRLLGAHECKLLVGTRGLLGEGWDCPQVNVLVDMTSVAADVSVRQMRGRSLRLDPGDPAKLANNWDVVCVAPELERGHADYGRFVRRHTHLHAPCEDGAIETGPSHVHPGLSPYGPPPAVDLPAINIEQRLRAQQLDDARARWRVGEPYRGVDLSALVVRRPPRAAAAASSEATGLGAPVPRGLGPRLAAAFGGRARLYPHELPLEWAAGAVCDAYVALGELTPAAAASLAFGVRPEGWVRVALPLAEPAVSEAVCGALDELVGGAALPRYTVSRRALRAGVGGWSRPIVVWHGVPSDLGRNKDRAAAFLAGWMRWVGPSALLYAHSSDDGARVAGEAAAGRVWETQRRRVWL